MRLKVANFASPRALGVCAGLTAAGFRAAEAAKLWRRGGFSGGKAGAAAGAAAPPTKRSERLPPATTS